jgi:hypothetical protein
MKLRYISNTENKYDAHAFIVRKGSRSLKMTQATQSMYTREVRSEDIIAGAVSQRLHLNLG